jgi:hypothetical protein
MTERTTHDDDIDLLVFLQRVLRYFRKFRWVFLAAAILGIAAGVIVYRALPKIYTSSMVVHSFMLTNQEQIQIIRNWNSLLRRGGHEELAGIFNCQPETLAKVKNIKAEEIQKVFNTLNPHGFTIEVNVTDNAVLDDLQKGIVHGFENTAYVKQRLQVKKDRMKLLIEETASEIQKLDSVKQMMDHLISGNSRSVSPVILDPAGINRQLVELKEKNLAYQEELQFTNAVQVLQSFSKFNKPTGPKLLPWIIMGLLVFLSLAFLYTIYRTLSDKLKAHGRHLN